ncbi:hypothetical protein HMPREF3222_00393 [Clostridium perfringens]|uniref:Uncharacterized protein n=1 Tax=Clostridium perfringens TaxID=1502 RepID=A0A133NDC8_CLOPF|nr:hypothetical protein HMPREF3222_00393 [Clostridium perfringens]
MLLIIRSIRAINMLGNARINLFLQNKRIKNVAIEMMENDRVNVDIC